MMRTKKARLLGPGLVACWILLSAAPSGLKAAQTQAQKADAAKTLQTKIDVGGYSLFANIAGEGSPTVIFEAGGGNTNSVWDRVQSEISKITKTVSYDRAGLGQSDRRNEPNTASNQVQELHTLLEKSDVHGPYIIVANSYGAFVARLFAAQYPDEVSGVVFVDGTHEKFINYLFKNLSPDQLAIFKKMDESNPDGDASEIVISARQVEDAGKRNVLRNKPVIVLSSDMEITAKQFANTPMAIVFPQWMNWQKDLAALSDRSRQSTVKGSGHLIHRDKPQVVIDAIKEMLAQVAITAPARKSREAETGPIISR